MPPAGQHLAVSSPAGAANLGLDFGRRPTFVPYSVPADTPKLSGVGHIIRQNKFTDCGICSMQGLGLFGGLIEDNTSSGCGWQRVSALAETGGIKLHYLKHVVVRRNRVYDTIDAPGLWVDHSNAGLVDDVAPFTEVV